ncbi:unnamed protein product [Cylicocyclus nassatus]|uniref:Uncharacterized protein n=1 Tax=Cylicocyclus nassatus TaxID=53992 RepID=A0AA36H8C2_CYLNA|nr:unnamed protein product [Cylicocyclus nassatus]
MNIFSTYGCARPVNMLLAKRAAWVLTSYGGSEPKSCMNEPYETDATWNLSIFKATFMLRNSIRTGTLQTHMLLNRTLLSLGLVHLKHRCCSRVRWVFPELSGLKHLRKYPLSLAATHSSA